MKRLTNNKEVSEMSMYELAHNSCYAKDRNARYRDFENDFDGRELTIKLLEKYTDIPNEFTCDDDFDDFMKDSLQYGMDDILGLIGVFYRNLWAMANLREHLKEYEDLEEQGKLLKLPCAVGDVVYVVNKLCTGEICVTEEKTDVGMITAFMLNEDFGKTVFLTQKEAEVALEKLKETEGRECEK